MNTYTFSVFQTHWEYPYSVSVEATDEEEAYKLVYERMQGVDDWEVLFVESECVSCGSTPEEVIIETDKYTICPKGCFIAF